MVSCTSTSSARSPRPSGRARLPSATARPRWSRRRQRNPPNRAAKKGAPRISGALLFLTERTLRYWIARTITWPQSLGVVFARTIDLGLDLAVGPRVAGLLEILRRNRFGRRIAR